MTDPIKHTTMTEQTYKPVLYMHNRPGNTLVEITMERFDGRGFSGNRETSHYTNKSGTMCSQILRVIWDE